MTTRDDAPSGMLDAAAGWLRRLTAKPRDASGREIAVASPAAVGRRREIVTSNGHAPAALTHADIAAGAARLLWAHRGDISVHGDVASVSMRHSKWVETSTIRIPGGVGVVIDAGGGSVRVTVPGGHTADIEHDDAQTLLATWRDIQCQAILEALGYADERPAGAQDAPDPTIRTRLVGVLADIIRETGLRRCSETYEVPEDDYGFPIHHYVPNAPQPTVVHGSEWYTIGHDVLLRRIQYGDSPALDEALHVTPAMRRAAQEDDRLPYMVSHPTMGALILPCREIDAAIEANRTDKFREALGLSRELPTHLPMPRGNATAERILRICREAVASDPHLADASGTPILPLVNEHLPALMRRHAEASANAPANQLAEIDAELAEGIEIVRRATAEALETSAVEKRRALQTELRFLRYRHPGSID